MMNKFYSFILLLVLTIPVWGCSVFSGDKDPLLRRKAMDHFGRGEILEKQGNYSLAIEEFLKSEELSPRPGVYYHLGHCYWKLQEPGRAVEFYQKAIDLSPDYKQAKIELALAEKEMNKTRPIANPRDSDEEDHSPVAFQETLPQNAITTDTSLLTKGKPDKKPLPLFFFRIGDTKKQDEIDTASLPSMNEVNKVLFPDSYKTESSGEKDDNSLKQYIDRKKKSQDSYSFHMDKARVYRDSKLYSTAALEYTDALKDNPQSLEALSALADMYSLMGKEEKGEEIFSQYQEHFQKDSRYFLKWGNILLQLNRLEKAKEKFLKAVELTPSYASPLNNLGIIELRMENYVKAAEYFHDVLTIDPNFASAHLNLGIVYGDHLNNPRKAREHYEKYLQLGGDRSEEVRKWLKALPPD